jgi:tetratricopeptide (TPR) repeat protein
LALDWTDKLSIGAIIGLTVITAAMMGNHELAKKREENPGLLMKDGAAYAAQIETDKKIYADVASYNKQGRHTEAMSELKNVMEKYPNKSLSYVYLARLYLDEGRLADSIHNYRRAVEMEPDYVDKKAPLFIGAEVRKVVREGVEKLQREQALRPKDKEVGEAIKDVYYLQRRLAGGCE